MSPNDAFLLLGLLVVYAPFLVAFGVFRGVPRAGVWKFVCCTLAGVAAIAVHFAVGLVLWLIAWLFAGITLQTTRREAVESATLRAMQEQNKLLKQELLTMQQVHPATFPETLPPTEHATLKRDGSSLH
jgi:hypothetical protein